MMMDFAMSFSMAGGIRMVGVRVAAAEVSVMGKTFSRFISRAELKAIEETGLLRGGRSGKTYFTTGKYQLVESSQAKLSLEKPAELRIDFRIVNDPKVAVPKPADPKYGQPGTGPEYKTTDPVKVEIIRVRELR